MHSEVEGILDASQEADLDLVISRRLRSGFLGRFFSRFLGWFFGWLLGRFFGWLLGWFFGRFFGRFFGGRLLLRRRFWRCVSSACDKRGAN